MAILNYGSLNVDHTYHVPHLVRPGETISATTVDVAPGGKGANQSAAAALASASVTHIGQVAEGGRFLIDELSARGVDTSGIRLGDVPTGRAIIQVDDAAENSIVLFSGANRAFAPGDVDSALDSAFERLPGEESAGGHVLLLQNEVAHVGHAIATGHERGLSVCLNPAPMTPAVADYPLELVDTLVVNEVEGAALVGGEANEEIFENLVAAYPHAAVILTVGADGVYAAQGAEVVRVEAERVEVVDTTGAGDTFIGYYLARRQVGDGFEGALRIANHAAALAVGRQGAMPSIPTLAEVLA